MTSKRVYIGGLNAVVTETEIRNRFSPFGSVVGVEMPCNSSDGSPRGFAYVDMVVTEQGFKKCQSVYGNCKWKGMKLKVELAKPSYMERLAKEWEEPEKPVKKKRKRKSSAKLVSDKPVTVQEAKSLKGWEVINGRALPTMRVGGLARRGYVDINPKKMVNRVRRFGGKYAQPAIKDLTWQLPEKPRAGNVVKASPNEFPQKSKRMKEDVVHSDSGDNEMPDNSHDSPLHHGSPIEIAEPTISGHVGVSEIVHKAATAVRKIDSGMLYAALQTTKTSTTIDDVDDLFADVETPSLKAAVTTAKKLAGNTANSSEMARQSAIAEKENRRAQMQQILSDKLRESRSTQLKSSSSDEDFRKDDNDSDIDSNSEEDYNSSSQSASHTGSEKEDQSSSEGQTEQTPEPMSLFDEGDDSGDDKDENRDDDEDAAKSFAIKSQFEGEKGEALFKQQQTFHGDDRFKLGPSFAESEEEGDDDDENRAPSEGAVTSDNHTAIDGEECNLKEEKKSMLSVLGKLGFMSSVSSAQAANSSKRNPNKLPTMNRYDPSVQAHSHMERPEEKQGDPKIATIAMSDTTSAPSKSTEDVGKETFVTDGFLKSMQESGKKFASVPATERSITTFSLFGNVDSDMEEEETAAVTNTTSLHTQDTEDGASNTVLSTQKAKQDEPLVPRDRFFFNKSDLDTTKCPGVYFVRSSTAREITQQWRDNRADLTRDFKRKYKNARRRKVQRYTQK